ncbi:MAG: response regulator [Opitutaceae bacterium]|jgi:two-component system response regulator HydG
MAMDSSSPSRLLIADDSIVCRNVLVILLENAGYEVLSVFDGRQAVLALRSQVFDLAILDNDMPNLDGLGALAELRSFLPKLPVVVYSATVSPTDAVRYRELGIDEILTKPVDPRALRDKVAHVLARHKMPAAAAAVAPALPIFRGPKPADAQSASSTPLIAGTSTYALNLQADLARLREFRSVAIVEGRNGSGRFEVAFQASPSSDARKFVCHPDALNAAHLASLLKPAVADHQPVLLVLLEAHHLTSDNQSLLEELVRGHMTEHASLTGRLRLALCSESSLCELHFNEFLLLRAATSTYTVPDFAARRQDWTEIARAILRRCGNGRSSLSPAAIQWIEARNWPGDYMQFHRTLELACKIAGTTSLINEAHLTEALESEPDYAAPLFHDQLFVSHSATTP